MPRLNGASTEGGKREGTDHAVLTSVTHSDGFTTKPPSKSILCQKPRTIEQKVQNFFDTINFLVLLDGSKEVTPENQDVYDSVGEFLEGAYNGEEIPEEIKAIVAEISNGWCVECFRVIGCPNLKRLKEFAEKMKIQQIIDAISALEAQKGAPAN